MRSIIILIFKVIELVSLLLKVKLLATQPTRNDVGHPWKDCAFQAYPCDMHMHIT